MQRRHIVGGTVSLLLGVLLVIAFLKWPSPPLGEGLEIPRAVDVARPELADNSLGQGRSGFSTEQRPFTSEAALVKTMNREGRPVEHATVSVGSDGRWTSLGLSDEKGLLTLSERICCGQIVVARSLEGAIGHCYVPDPAPMVVEIVLEDVRQLRGRLVVPCPEFSLADTEVIVIPYAIASAVPPTERDWSALLAHPAALHASPGPSGEFDVLVPTGQQLFVSGGGRGLAFAPVAIPIDDPAPFAELHVVRLHALLVEFVDSQGAAMELPAIGGPHFGLRVGVTTEGARMAAVGGLGRAAAGIPQAPPGEGRPCESIFVAAAPGCTSEFVTFQVNGQFPGFLPFSASMDVAPSSQGPSRLPIHLVPTTHDLGDIRLLTKSTNRPKGLPRPAGSLILRDSAGEVQPYIVSTFNEGEAVVHSVPCGLYEARFEWNPSLLGIDGRSPSWRQIRVTRGVTEFETDDANEGRLVIRMIDERGADYAGPASFIVGLIDNEDEATNSMSWTGPTIQFARGPYVLPAVVSGRFTVLLFPPDHDPRRRSAIHILPGQTVQLTFPSELLEVSSKETQAVPPTGPGQSYTVGRGG